MKKLAALFALTGAATIAAAQPGTRNAIVYGARLPGETTWTFGSVLSFRVDSNPWEFEVGVFFFRAQGVGHATGVFKTYINDVSTPSGDSTVIVDDLSNGASPEDGRVGVFNSGAQTQKVFTNRNANIGGTGFRISSTADSADASAAGGISVKQAGPLNNPAFEQGDGLLGYRFNVTVAQTGFRDILVHTPTNRINSYTSYNTLDSNTTTEFKTSTVSDSIVLQCRRVPAPSALTVLGLGGLLVARRRR